MRPLVVVPLGSWEQHGGHLPPATDSLIIEAVVTRAARGRDVVVAPVVSITASDEHRGFADTLSIGTQAMMSSLVGIATSAGWSRGVVFANGHGGNADALREAGQMLNHNGVRHAVWSLPAYAGADAHAGHTETSVMLHLHPDMVDMNAAHAGNTAPVAALMNDMRAGGVRAVSQSGILGDPTTADAAHGEAVMELWVASLARTLDSAEQEWV